jgi:hypothetical protein
VQANLLEWTQGRAVRFVTLTLARTDQPLQMVLAHLMESFKRLRRQDFWVSAVKAGTAVVEITRGASGGHWHAHLHVLTVGTWMDYEQLRDGWTRATNGSSIVDVRLVRDAAAGAGYVAKYATKGWSQSVLDEPDALIECICALRGKRLLISFGDWYGREGLLCKPQPTDWKVVGYIRDLHRDSLAGEPHARRVFEALGFAAGLANGLPVFLGPDPRWSGP